MALGLGLRLGRVVSYIAAVTVTWMLNRRFTFRGPSRFGVFAEWLRFAASQLGGASINLGLYYLLIHTSALVVAHPVLGVAAGSLSGLSINYIVARLYIFRTQGVGRTDGRP